MPDVIQPLITGGAALTGASIGVISSWLVAKRTRAADRRKRCIDRFVDTSLALEQAYTEYVRAKPGDQRIAALSLHAAVRSYDLAAHLIDHHWIRHHAIEYGKKLRLYYLFADAPRDELDSEFQVPTADDLNQEHLRLAEKLRHYEAK